MRRELLLLREMRDPVAAIRDPVGDRSAEQVEADPLRRSALLWHVTVLGEAASQIPSGTKDSPRRIAWRVAGLFAAFFEEIAWTGFATHELRKRHGLRRPGSSWACRGAWCT